MKDCRGCGAIKPLSEYYRHPKMADGHLNHCTACKKSDAKRHRVENAERVKAYDIERSQQPGRKLARKRYIQNYREKFPERERAKWAVSNAVRRGQLMRQPCEECGRHDGVDAHHDDYSRPLDVVWLCRQHHKDRHARRSLPF